MQVSKDQPRFVERETPEWATMWAALRALPLNKGFDVTVSHNCEYWQYMGTWYIGNGWIHQFRHRWHPGTNKREYVNIPA